MNVLDLEELMNEYKLSPDYELDIQEHYFTTTDLGNGFRRIGFMRVNVVVDSTDMFNASRMCAVYGLNFFDVLNSEYVQGMLNDADETYTSNSQLYIEHVTDNPETNGYYVNGNVFTLITHYVPPMQRFKYEEIAEEVERGMI